MSGYGTGRRYEWKVRDALADDGYDVIRAAGSKGKVDLVAMKPGELLFIQCKRTNGTIPPAERRELLRLADLVDAVPIVAHGPGPIRYRELLGREPKQWRPWTPDTVGVGP